MQTNTATKFLPIVSDDKKVEVSLTDNQAIIKLSTWTEDLGWLCQKTLSIDAAMLDDLHHVISSARYRLNKQKSETAEPIKAANVLEFPIFSSLCQKTKWKAKFSKQCFPSFLSRNKI